MNGQFETHFGHPSWVVFSPRTVLGLDRHQFSDFADREQRKLRRGSTQCEWQRSNSLLQLSSFLSEFTNLCEEDPNLPSQRLAEVVHISVCGGVAKSVVKSNGSTERQWSEIYRTWVAHSSWMSLLGRGEGERWCPAAFVV